MKAIFRYLGLLAAAVAVGAGCMLVDARANPVLWYVMWGLCLVIVLIGIWLEWGIWPRWVSVVSILVFYVPAWVGVWLNSWGYVSDSVAYWTIFAGIMVVGALQTFVDPVPEKHGQPRDGTVVSI